MKSILIFMALLVSSGAAALGNVTAYEDLPFSSVQELQLCGAWTDGKQQGQFRLLRVYLYGQDMLFVDLVTLNDEQTRWIVSKGFTFTEFNNDHAELSLTKLRCRASGENRIAITGRAEHADGEKRRFRLDVTTSAYEFKKLK